MHHHQSLGSSSDSEIVHNLPGINTKERFNGSENIESIYAMLRQAKITAPYDPLVIECELENVTGVIFPEVMLYGLDTDSDYTYYDEETDTEEITPYACNHAFLKHKTSLFPNDITRFTFSVIPAEMDFDNGITFLLYHVMPIN